MAQVGRKIYYEKSTGNVILDTGERSGDVVETTVEQDFESYRALAERVPETVGMIQLEFGQFAEDFAVCSGFRVNPETEEIEFSYPDPNDPAPEPVFRKPLTEEVDELKAQNAQLLLANAQQGVTIQQQQGQIAQLLLQVAQLQMGGGA